MIENFGPPRIFSTINFESLHSLLKSEIKNSRNWKSVCYTIATKYARSQLFFQEPAAQEFGISSYLGPLPSFMSNVNSDLIQSLSGLKFLNQNI